MYLTDGVIYSINIYAYDTTLFSKYDQTPDLWKELVLAYEFKSDLQGTVGWEKGGFLNSGKTKLGLFEKCYNSDAIF